MKASSPTGRGRVQAIKAKTEKLIQLKKRYNAEVAEVDKELSEKLEKLSEETVHVPLKLALTCVNAIQTDRSLIPEVIEELKELLSLSSIDDTHDQSLKRSSHLATSSDDELKSDSDSLSDGTVPNLESISLDVNHFLKQYEQDEHLSIELDS